MLYKEEPAQSAPLLHDAVLTRTGKEQALFGYRKWFKEQAERDRTQEKEDENEYKQIASQPVVVRNREFHPFTNFNDNLSALRTFTRGQIVVIVCVLLALVVGFSFYTDITLLVVASLFVFALNSYNLVLLCLSAGTFVWSPDIKIDDEVVHALRDVEWPNYTVLCPLYREAAVVRQLVDGLQRLDYPSEKLEIFLLVEEHDHEKLEALQPITLPPHIQIVLLPPGEPRTKPRSCNYGLLKATGEYLVIYDAEDIPDPLQLKKVILAFADSSADVACIQAKLNFYNSHQNLLTHWFTAEYSARYDLTLPALYRAGLTIPLGGASNHFRIAMLREVGAWDIYNVTEDCDLGNRLAHYQYRTAILDSTTYEEANSRVKNWIRQRSRWIKGLMQTYLVYMRTPWQFVQRKRWRQFVSLQFVIGGNFSASIAGPLLWVLFASTGLLGLVQGRQLFLLTALICAIGLLCGNILSMALALLGCAKRHQYDLLKWMVLQPLYVFLLGMGALVALYQIITKPHYWEKTEHGLGSQEPAQVLEKKG